MCHIKLLPRQTLCLTVNNDCSLLQLMLLYIYISVVCVVTTVFVAVAAAVAGQSSTFIDFLLNSYENTTFFGSLAEHKAL